MAPTPADRPTDRGPLAAGRAADDAVTPAGEEPPGKAGFNEYLLATVVLFSTVLLALGIGLYLLPADYLQIPELQPVARVAAQADLPVGASRVVSWGPKIVLIVRTGEREYAALQGNSPIDGCILEWDAASSRVVSPCNHLVYDLHGNVVSGLTTVPLRRYSVFVRQGIVYVKES